MSIDLFIHLRGAKLISNPALDYYNLQFQRLLLPSTKVVLLSIVSPVLFQRSSYFLSRMGNLQLCCQAQPKLQFQLRWVSSAYPLSLSFVKLSPGPNFSWFGCDYSFHPTTFSFVPPPLGLLFKPPILPLEYRLYHLPLWAPTYASSLRHNLCFLTN